MVTRRFRNQKKKTKKCKTSIKRKTCRKKKTCKQKITKRRKSYKRKQHFRRRYKRQKGGKFNEEQTGELKNILITNRDIIGFVDDAEIDDYMRKLQHISQQNANPGTFEFLKFEINERMGPDQDDTVKEFINSAFNNSEFDNETDNEEEEEEEDDDEDNNV
jgi:hypothetical protein